MRRYSREFASLLTLLFAVSGFSPLLLCGGSSFTKAEASDCCRAMQFKCHKNNGDEPCCKHRTVAPLHLALTSTFEVAAPQPPALRTLVPIVAGSELLTRQAGHQFSDLFAGHSPPETVPLFLLHSTLLV